MALLTFFLALGFLYFPPLLLCSTQENNNSNSKPFCPDFQCRNFGSFGFPFYSSDPRCGLCRLDCNQTVPRIQLSDKDQTWYNITWLRNSSIVIRDKVFADQIRSRNCDIFRNLTFPNTSSISYYISSPLTLFRCSKRPEVTLRTDSHFNSMYQRYRDCQDFNLYYKYPANFEDISDRFDIPQECLIIQLPHLTIGPLPPGANHSDLFQILAANITLVLNISEDCLRCHYKGGKCQNEGKHVLCIYAAKEKGNKKVVIAVVAIGSAFILAICLAFMIRRLCKWSKIPNYFSSRKSTLAKHMALPWKKAEKYQNVENFLKNYGSLAPKRYSYSDVKKMTNSFKSKLGQGGYGQVYKGRLDNGNLVAVKILNGSKGNGEDFINEVASISRTSHVNIVSFLGFCFEGHKRALVYEFMPNGSLEKFIYNKGNSLKDRQLGWEKLYQIAIGIARGLEYLHRGCNTRILHFDIKPQNILLNEDFCPKIADFGLAKLCPGKESVLSTLTARGTIGYIAPEVFCRNFGGVSYKSDVYSYGMMVSEMVGGRKNIEVKPGQTSEIYFPHWIHKRLESGNQLGLHGIMNDGQNEMARKMIIVSLWCIQTDPLSRPSMTRVVEMLEASLESLQIPPKPYLFSPSRSPERSSTIGIL